jgi:hypothetical protein
MVTMQGLGRSAESAWISGAFKEIVPFEMWVSISTARL